MKISTGFTSVLYSMLCKELTQNIYRLTPWQTGILYRYFLAFILLQYRWQLGEKRICFSVGCQIVMLYFSLGNVFAAGRTQLCLLHIPRRQG